jgi:hypothetical protein
MPDTAEIIEEIRSLSPPEFIKAANARDQKIRQAENLHRFFGYLQNTAGLLREVPENKINALIDDYLNATGVGHV